MFGSRILILVIVVMGLTALAATVAPRDSGFTRQVSPPRPVQTPSGEPEAGPADGPLAEDGTIAGEPATIRIDATDTRRVVDAPLDEPVQIEVAADQLATVQVGEDGPIEAVDPDAPARFDLTFDRPGRQEVRLLGDDPAQTRTVGVLRVR